MLNADKDTSKVSLRGLTSEEVIFRTENGLSNEATSLKTKSYFKIIISNLMSFCNILIIFLIVLLTSIGAWDYTISSFIIFLNIGIGIIQEIKAKWTIEKLAINIECTCDVLRDGEYKQINTKELVVDDVYVLLSGSHVPADSILLDGVLEVDESIITGESVAVKKIAGEKILKGSSVVSGKSNVRAVKTGKDCYVENVAEIIKQVKKPKSNIFYVLNKIIKGTTFVLIPLGIMLFIANIRAGRTLSDNLITVSSSVLGMIPVGMFLLTSTALAASVIKLSKKNVLTQDLYCIEMLALVDVLLLDKTGTITEGALEICDTLSLSEEDQSFNIQDIIATLISVSNDNNSTAKALKKYCESGNTLDVKNFLPFNSERKYSAIELANGERYILGAPDFLSFLGEDIKSYEEKNSKLCRRTILFGRITDGIGISNVSKSNIKPLCLFAFEDRLRGDVKETLEWFKNNNVELKIISGDNPRTVSEIAKRAGICDKDNYINCSEFSDDELDGVVEETKVFGRTSPEQKAKIVKSLQSRGHTVGMIGDGINDTQALKAADCSISFSSANEVARNLSRIVMMDSDFKNIPKALGEGKRVITNIERVAALYIMKNIFVMFLTFAYFILSFVDESFMYPLNTKKMLMTEFFVLGVPAFILAMQKNNYKDHKGDFMKNILRSGFSAAIGIIFAVAYILVYSYINDFEYQYMSSLAALTLAMSSYAALFIVTINANKISKAAVIIMIFVSIAAVIIDKAFLNSTFLNIDFPQLKHVPHILVGAGISVIINLILRKLINFIYISHDNKINSKIEYMKSANFNK